MELRIDPEFEEKIPPLTDDEFQQLENNILADGIVINPIIVWNGVIVDGHNRYRIVSKHPHITFTTCEKDFSDRYEAIAWICKNQLGRRNLTPNQKKYLIGKQYEAEKCSHGAKDGFRGNQHQELVSSQNGNLPKHNKTCERIAEENGISKNSVLRAEAYSKAVDIADEIEPGIRTEFLSGSIRATEKEIHALARADPDERPAIIADLRKPPAEKAKSAKEEKPPNKKPLLQLQQISEDMLSAKSRGTQADMLYELEDALDSLMFRWTMCLGNYRDYFADDACRLQINQLIRTGMEYLQQIIEGEIPV